jgi:hypothetical protein
MSHFNLFSVSIILAIFDNRTKGILRSEKVLVKRRAAERKEGRKLVLY